MTLQAGLILLGVIALALIFVVSFWKDRVGGLFSRKQRMPVIRDQDSYGLTPSREFFLDPVPRGENNEPVLEPLDDIEEPESGEVTLDFDPQTEPEFDAVPEEDIPLQESESPVSEESVEEVEPVIDPEFDRVMKPRKKRINLKLFSRKKDEEPQQSDLFADVPKVEDRVEPDSPEFESSPVFEPETDDNPTVTDELVEPEEVAEGSLKQLDFWVRIYGDEPVMRDAVLGVYRQQEYLLEHSHSIHGRLVNGNWSDLEDADESASFNDLILTLQLSDRTGPVTESELTKFTNLVFSLAEALDRKFNFQCSVEEAQAQAERLDQFSKKFDLLAIINICGEEGRTFKGSSVLRAVEGAGMRYGDMKVFHGPESADGSPMFSLANMVKPGIFELGEMDHFETPGLTLFMNVPKCANPGEVFSRMSYVAEKIATQLGGVLKDQKHQVLDDKAVRGIGRQVEEIGREMLELGMEPGSEEARRLF